MADEPRFLSRLYIAGRGYCYFRSSAMSDGDSQRLIDVIGRLQLPLQATDCSDHCCEIQYEGTDAVFLRTKSVPDPDNPRRNALALCLWITDRALTDTVEAEKMFSKHPIPRTQLEAERMGWKHVRGTTIEIGHEAGATNAGQVSIRRSRSVMRLIIIGATAIACVTFLISKLLVPDSSNTPQKPKTEDLKNVDSRWDETRNLIRDIIRQKGSQADNMNDYELISLFIARFRRPQPETFLNKSADLNAYQAFDRPHPFKDYLNSLPDALSVPQHSREGSWRELSAETIMPLTVEMRQRGFDISAEPQQMVRDLRDQCLNYPDFFETWRKRNPGFERLTVWCDQNDGIDPSYCWVPATRAFLKREYGGDNQ